MNLSIIMVVVLYEILSIGVVSYIIRKNQQKKGMTEGDFALGGRSLGTWAVGSTMCLTLLGSGHLTGTWEGCLTLGESQIWHVMANGFAMALGAVTIYCWARRMRITTTGDMTTKLYCKELTVLIAAANIAVGWAVTSFETQALGIIINSMTGFPLRACILISGVIGLCYIIFGGTKQAAMLNQINIIILYVGMFGALFFVMKALPGMNFDTISAYYESRSAEYPHFLEFTGGTEHFIQVAIPILIAPFFAHLCGQQTIQTAASAKSEKSLRRIAWFVGPMNVIIGAISICIAMTARTLPEYAEYSDKLVTTQYLVSEMPTWFIAILFAAFVAALLSSYGGFLIGPATVITVDFVKQFYKKDMSEKQEANMIRIFIAVGAVVTNLMAQTLPVVVNMFTWVYSFMIPVVFLIIFGLWWKRNKTVGILSFIIPFVVATIWTLFPAFPDAIGLGNVHIAYVIIVVSLVILIVGNLICKGEPGYFRSAEWLKSKEYEMYQEEKAKGNA